LSGTSDARTRVQVGTDQPASGVENRPRPRPTATSKEYWRSAAQGTLAIQRCKACRRWNHPPVVACSACGSQALAFEPVAGSGAIHQLVLVRQSRLDGFETRTPYLVAAVELDEQSRLAVVANIITDEIGQVQVGQRVRVSFEQIDADLSLPQFVVES
jgi:uncharacterized OB-fold protein